MLLILSWPVCVADALTRVGFPEDERHIRQLHHNELLKNILKYTEMVIMSNFIHLIWEAMNWFDLQDIINVFMSDLTSLK